MSKHSETINSGISRRNFLTGAAGVGALAAFGLAGCGQPTVVGEGEPAAEGEASATQASSTTATDWLGEEPEVGEVASTVDVDLLICGCGMSGAVAGATAADLGLNFAIIEKGAEVAASHYDIGAIHSRYQQELDLDFDEKRWLNEWTRYASFKNDQSVARTWVENSGATVEWLADLYTEFLGTDIEVVVDEENDNAGGTTYFMPPECHHIQKAGVEGRDGWIEHVEVLSEYMASKGTEVTYNTKLVRLLHEDGKVTGAIAEGPDGLVQYNTSNVIIATGGYAANPDMLKSRNPIVPKCVTSLNYNQNNDGSGIKAALWAGADMDTEAAAMIFDRGIVMPGVDAGYTDEGAGMWPTGGQFNLGSQPFLKVDRLGERICNESANYDAICHAAASHPGGVWCQVFDVNAPEDVQRFKTQGCSANTWKFTLKDTTVDEAYADRIDEGLICKADTLDELADMLGFEGDAKTQFLATVDDYNAMYDAQEDTQFGKEAYRLSAIREAPFYGAWYGGSLLTTIDGVRINRHCQALDANRQPIEGLYMVGTASGSYYAGNYPVYLVGNCLGRQVTFGRYAVRHAAGDIA
ncbi:FAD-dependent oxidoreductase [Slackia heliotrinireducens]|uniref:FAD-dependent oxidoreductase n=1 Tax=Slackia heliotrinireducens TaxID=84110 RepID=UPI00331472DA